jgi:hypothetical protein
VSIGGASSNLRASIFENAAVLPSSRLIVGRSTSNDRIASHDAVPDHVLEQTGQRHEVSHV